MPQKHEFTVTSAVKPEQKRLEQAVSNLYELHEKRFSKKELRAWLSHPISKLKLKFSDGAYNFSTLEGFDGIEYDTFALHLGWTDPNPHLDYVAFARDKTVQIKALTTVAQLKEFSAWFFDSNEYQELSEDNGSNLGESFLTVPAEDEESLDGFDRRGAVFLAYYEEKLVGVLYVDYGLNNEHLDFEDDIGMNNAKTCLPFGLGVTVSSMSVHRDYRNQGIGRTLMAALAKSILNYAYEALEIKSKHLINLNIYIYADCISKGGESCMDFLTELLKSYEDELSLNEESEQFDKPTSRVEFDIDYGM